MHLDINYWKGIAFKYVKMGTLAKIVNYFAKIAQQIVKKKLNKFYFLR